MKLELLFDFFILAVAASRYVLYYIVWFLTSSLHRFKMIRNCSKKTQIASFIFNNFSRKICISLCLRRTYSFYEIWPIYWQISNSTYPYSLYKFDISSTMATYFDRMPAPSFSLSSSATEMKRRISIARANVMGICKRGKLIYLL